MTELTVAAIAVALIGVTGAIIDPSQAASILSFVGGLLVVLVTALRELKRTHDAVNSKMDRLIEVNRKFDRLDATTQDRERVAELKDKGDEA